MSFRILFPLLAAVAFSLSAQQAQPPQMTARELFYNAGSPPSAKPQAKIQSKTDQSKTSVAVARKKTEPPVTQQATNVTPPQSAGPVVVSAAPSTPDGSGQIIAISETVRTTAPAPASGTALGLKYTILKLSGNAMAPVAPSSVFHAGDRIQFSIETNGPGYLYIVNQGSSGTWKPVFPAPEIEGGNNRVEGFHTYTFPNGYRYVFDQQVGDEKVFIILSRDPKPDFEQLVYSLQGGKTPVSQPATPPAAQDKPVHVMRASIDDTAVGRLHQAYARDLVIERVGDDVHAAPDSAAQEKAVYVVNATGSADSALVADLHLVHQ